MKTNFKNNVTSALIFFGLAVTAYGKEKIKVYTVAKEKPSATQTTTGRTGIPTVDAPISWETPRDWKELPATSIRIGNFQVTGKSGQTADVAITSFPGNVGSDLDNWNRWRNELKLAPTAESEITSEKTKVGPLDANLYDISGETQRTVVASLPKDGATWFFKLRGDTEVVAGTKETFVAFLKTIQFDGAKAANKVAAAEVPADPHANVPEFAARKNARADAADGDSEGLPEWAIPTHWKEKPAAMMVTKSYSVTNDKGDATVAISVFPGDVGGTFANVNRWRGQMGLKPVPQNELSKVIETIEIEGGKATLVDFKGTDGKTGKPARMVAASVPHGDSTWFYKMTGDDAAVASEKERLIKLIKTVRYP